MIQFRFTRCRCFGVGGVSYMRAKTRLKPRFDTYETARTETDRLISAKFTTRRRLSSIRGAFNLKAYNTILLIQ